MQVELDRNHPLSRYRYRGGLINQERERGVAMVEIGLCLPLIVLLFIMLTEIGFLVMSRHALDLAAGQALAAGTILPLSNSNWVTPLEDASEGPCNDLRTLDTKEAREKLMCFAGVIARAYLSKHALIGSEPGDIEVQASMVKGTENSVDGPPTGILSIKVVSKHKWFFSSTIPGITISGTKSARYIFAPY